MGGEAAGVGGPLLNSAGVGAAGTDRIEPATRVLAGVIVPFLVVAFVILYLRPDDTGRLFAWPIAPRMSAYLLGSAYIGGAYFFVRVVFERRWHRIAVGFLPVTSFATLMMVTTLVHWDRFTHGSVAFATWVTLYATTPLLVLGVWLRNRGADAGLADADDVELPPGVRRIAALCGAVVLGAGLFLVAVPAPLIQVWPWSLTTLTARVTGACFALAGVFGVTIARDRRWSTARIALQSQAFAIGLILLGAARARREFATQRPATWIFVVGLAAMLVAIVGLYAALEWRRAGRRPGSTTTRGRRTSRTATLGPRRRFPQETDV